MASDSQTVTATEKSLENKVEEEAKSMEKEIVLSETVDVMKDKTESDSNLAITKEEEIDQTRVSEVAKESPAVVEEVVTVVKAEEPTEKDENSEKVAEPMGLNEPILVKEGVEAVIVEETIDEQTVERVVEEDNKDKVIDVFESTDEAIAKHVEQVDVQSVGDVSAETAQDKDVEVLEVEPKSETEKVEPQVEKAKELAPVVEVVKAVETPEATEQAKPEIEIEGKVEDKIVETKDDSALSPEKIILTNQESETDPKKDTEEVTSSPVDVIEKAITEEKHVVDEPLTDEKASESASALCPTNQDSDADPKKETEVDASSPADVIEKAITEEKHVVDEPSKDEKASESGSHLSPEKAGPTNQDSDTNTKKETEGDASSSVDAIEKAITEEKHLVEENVSEAKDVVSKLATEGENIKKDTEPVADSKSEETQKETASEKQEESITEKVAEVVETEKQEESITEKVAEVVETEAVAKESDEPKQELEVTTKEVAVKQKHSNSIMSKVKQSLVKAKKAIIGKSPSSKTTTTEEAKGEIKVKS